MNKFIDILNQIDPNHGVRFVGWSADFFDDENWPCVMEFNIYKAYTDGKCIAHVFLEEQEVDPWPVELLKDYYNDHLNGVIDIKFYFNDHEVIPSLGDVGHSDKITHINFEPKLK